MDEDTNRNKQGGARKKQKDTFTDDLSQILFAYGDNKIPKDETVKVLEEYLLFFLDKLMTKIQNNNLKKDTANMKITKEDVLFAIRNDPKWLSRTAYMIQKMNESEKFIQETKMRKD